MREKKERERGGNFFEKKFSQTLSKNFDWRLKH
jgi:hypothetical protein